MTHLYKITVMIIVNAIAQAIIGVFNTDRFIMFIIVIVIIINRDSIVSVSICF